MSSLRQIIECVPNISEGRNTKIIDELAFEIKRVSGIKLLDIHSDVDHNRSVYTFIGSPAAVREAAFVTAKTAVRLIELNEHHGVHPRIGVIDVIPFIPVLNSTLDDCTAIALTLGQELESKLGLPVYYYGLKLSTESELQNKAYLTLPLLRKNIIDSENHSHHTAGSVAIGVRDFLVAYNVNLATADLSIAKKIAKKIREKDGGLPGLRALGLELKSRGIVQVSTNIINPKLINHKQVYQAIAKEAALLGIPIIAEEIVGLLPEQVIEEAK